MALSAKIFIIIAVVLLLGIIVFPLFNRWQFNRLAPELQVRAIMKQANSLAFFKNVSKGRSGRMYFVKNKRKILVFDWVLDGGNMLVINKNPFSNWDYPEEKEALNEDDCKFVLDAVEKYNKKHAVKLVFKNQE
ncbi:MAG: hypothetical protein J5964_05450 [Eubacterium sp.]|nr:hypothetical protein [Eubacterium sp.]